MTKQKTAESRRVKMRLPRVGCFATFLIFFALSVGFATALYHTLLRTPPAWEQPDAPVFLYDQAEVLSEDDREELLQLAAAIAGQARCDVAVMFVDEQTAPFADLARTIAAEWNPARGVLLLTGVRNGAVRLELLGEEWRLTGWDAVETDRALLRYNASQRGAAAIALLKRLKNALERTPPDGEAAVLTVPPVLFARGDVASGVSPMQFALVCAGLSIGIGLMFRLTAPRTLRRNRQNNAAILENFRKQVRKNPRLELVDLNAEKTSWTHRKGLRIAALVLGLLCGLNFTRETLTEPIAPDRLFAPADMLPETLPGRVVDQADVFSPEEREMLAAAIARAERATGGEIVVLTIRRLPEGQSIEEFSLETASAWRIGKQGEDNGALLTLAIDDRKNRLEIGYGWEGPINDAKAGDMLRAIVPELRAEQYAEAAAKVVAGIEQAVVGSGSEGRSAASAQPTVVATVSPAEPETSAHDPRKNDSAADNWAIFGILGTLAGIMLGYRGRLIVTSEPHWFIHDPNAVRAISYSGGSDSSSGSSSSSSSDSGGGGSFGGGGASGSW